jgi:hypothetical protein
LYGSPLGEESASGGIAEEIAMVCPFYSGWINLINPAGIQGNSNPSYGSPVGEAAALGGIAEEIAALPVNRIGDEAIGEQVCSIARIH